MVLGLIHRQQGSTQSVMRWLLIACGNQVRSSQPRNFPSIYCISFIWSRLVGGEINLVAGLDPYTVVYNPPFLETWKVLRRNLPSVSELPFFSFSVGRPEYTVASGYGDGSIRIWDIAKGTCEVTLNGHKGATTALRYNDTGSLLASGSKDTDIIIWDAVGEAGLFRFRGHRDQVTDLVFLDHGKRLVSSCKDNFVRVWDLDTQHCMQILSSHHSEIWSLDVDCQERFLVTGAADQYLRVYNIHQDMIEEQTTNIGAENVNLDNAENGVSKQSKWDVLSHLGNIKRESKDRVVTVRFNSSGSLLACQVAGKVVDIYRVLNEQEALKKAKRRSRRKREKVLKKAGTDTANDEDSQTLEKQEDNLVGISASDVFQFLHVLRTKQKIRSISFCPLQPKKGIVAVLALSLHSNALEIYEVGDESCRQIHAINLPGHGSDIRNLTLSSDSTLLMSTSHNAVKIWNPSTCSCLRTMEAGYGLCGSFVPGNRYTIVGTKAGTLEIFDIGAGERSKVIEAHSGSVWSLVPTPDGKGFVTGSADHDVKFWEYQLLEESDHVCFCGSFFCVEMK
eukprot:Gb_01025 [translate_table: standard]